MGVRKMEQEEDEEEEHSASDNCNPLDLDLLPPVPWLSTRQKQDLLRELHAEVRDCKGKDAKPGGSSPMGSRFSSVMSYFRNDERTSFFMNDERTASATSDGDAASANSGSDS